MKNGTPSRQPVRRPGFPPCKAGFFQAGRFILPALLCGLQGSYGEAGLWPGGKEWQPERRLAPGGARKAQAMALYLKAARMLEEHGVEAALPLYQQVMNLDPGSGELASLVARLAESAGKPEEARRLLEAAVAKNPDQEAPAAALASFLIARQHENIQAHAEALTFLRKAQTKFPASASLCRLAVRMYLHDQQRDEAQAAVRTALEHGSPNPRWWLEMAGLARDAFPLDDPDTRTMHLGIVAGCVEKAMALGPEHPGVLEQAGDFYARLQDQPQAIACYRRTVAVAPGNLGARRKLGQCLRIAGETRAARELFEELVRIDAADTTAHRALASLCSTAGDPKGALHHRAALLRLDGGTPDEYLKLAEQLAESGMTEDRRLLLERGSYMHPRSARLAVANASALHGAGQMTEASAEFDRALAAASQFDPAALDDTYFLARAAFAKDAGERETAAVHYRKAIDRIPKNAPARAVPAYTGLAVLWLEAGEKLEEARELLRLAASLKKDDAGVTRALALYEEKKARGTAPAETAPASP